MGKMLDELKPVYFTKDEIIDLLENLEQCWSEGYMNTGDPALSAMEKLETILREMNEIQD